MALRPVCSGEAAAGMERRAAGLGIWRLDPYLGDLTWACRTYSSPADGEERVSRWAIQ